MTLRTRQLRLIDQAYFIYDHLEGEAKDEIRYRPKAEREDPEQSFAILQDLYGCWEWEGRHDEPRDRSFFVPSFSAMPMSESRIPSSGNSEMTELKQMLQKQQEQLYQLT